VIAALLGSSCGCSIVSPADVPWVPEASYPDADDVRGIRLDEQQVPGYQDVKDQLSQFKLDEESKPLTAAECACLAAAHSEMALLLEKEAANTRRELHRHRRRGPSELLPGILRDQAAEERNNSAEQALVAYYQLADVHLQNTILVESRQELRSMRETVAVLRDAGVPIDTDLSELDRRISDLDRQDAELDVNEARLTARIKTLVAEDPYSPIAIETNCSVDPRPVSYELFEAMEIARSNDSQLRAINKFLHHGTTDDLEMGRSLLQVAAPLLGQAPGPIGCLARLRAWCGHNEQEETELRVRKQQLRELYQLRKNQLDLEVANGIISVRQHFLGVGIARDIFQSWDTRVAVLESQRESQLSNYQDLMDAKFNRLKARSDLLHKLMLLEIEHAKLRGSMGLLGSECGYGMHGGHYGQTHSSDQEPCHRS
jgi:hypothetical protein